MAFSCCDILSLWHLVGHPHLRLCLLFCAFLSLCTGFHVPTFTWHPNNWSSIFTSCIFSVSVRRNSVPDSTKGRRAGHHCKNMEMSQHTDFNDVPLIKGLVWPVATYGCERWTLRKNEETRLDAFEMTRLIKILRLLWTVKKTNEWVFNKAGVKRKLLCLVYTVDTDKTKLSCLRRQFEQNWRQVKTFVFTARTHRHQNF